MPNPIDQSSIATPRSRPVYGRAGRIGLVVPANNSVIEPEWWSVLPAGVAAYATRVMARGALTHEAIERMERQVDRAVDELAATGVDVIAYADMVTTFIMARDWNEQAMSKLSARTGVPCVSAWTALRDALSALGIRRFALGTPYPAAIHALARPFFEAAGYTITADATLDITQMAQVPWVDSAQLTHFVGTIVGGAPQAIVLLATDLPTFACIESLEASHGCPVLSSNQSLLWATLHAARISAMPVHLGQLMNCIHLQTSNSNAEADLMHGGSKP